MINHEKWINSLPTNNKKISDDIDELDHERWTNTIPKKHKNNSIQIYSLVAVFFISGLLIVSVIKNKTRNLQKEINNLQASVNLIKFDLDQAILDNEVITSPANISLGVVEAFPVASNDTVTLLTRSGCSSVPLIVIVNVVHEVSPSVSVIV